jgi:hypothetical protein
LKLLRGGLLPLLLSACLFGGDEPLPEVSPDRAEAAQRLSARLDSFYQQLAGVPLDAVSTYDTPSLRSYFTGPSAFSDYYASLANQARDAGLRSVTAEGVRVREFYFDDADTANVNVVILGRHQRRLRFWQIELERTDTWRRLNGVWLLVPAKL